MLSDNYIYATYFNYITSKINCMGGVENISKLLLSVNKQYYKYFGLYQLL